MIYKDFYPFYTSYANPLLYRGEKEQEEEFFLMKSYYPDTARKIQEKVEEECDLQDYEGSRLYDEYPDRFMLYHLGRKIVDEVKMPTKKMQGRFLQIRRIKMTIRGCCERSEQ